VIATPEDNSAAAPQFDGTRPLGGGTNVAFDAPPGSTLWLHAKDDAELEVDGAFVSIPGASSFRGLNLGHGPRHEIRVTRGVVGLAWVEGATSL
jgi:hypothetical protein